MYSIYLMMVMLLTSCAAPGGDHEAPQDIAQPMVMAEYQPLPGTLRIGPEPQRAIPLTEKGYTLVLPAGEAKPAGLVVFLDGWKVDTTSTMWASGTLEREALTNQVGLLRLTTGNPLDFYFDEETLRDVVERLQAVLTSNDLRNVPLFFAGMSLGGTRALKLTIFLKQHGDAYWARTRAVAIVDAPLDMVRFWGAEQRAVQDAFHPAAADEGQWVSYLLEENLGGTPQAQWDQYVAYSPYVHTAPRGGNARYLLDLPLRAYHEPDIAWWIEYRRKSYYQMNSIDLAALINALKLQGHKQAELVTTHQAREGYEESSSPHTWTMVDNADLVRWFLAQR